MALKFKCAGCGEDMLVKFLHAGEKAKCRNCGAKNAVPDKATEVGDEQADAYMKAFPKSVKAENTRVSCAACRYAEIGGDESGKCHRYPPQNDEYPIVTDADWCGEYVKKD